ncbi:transcription elongation factor SPT4-like [Argopecten irradians]|uniref:transcription elongation factor SPT4-like n=1 Tax=Argopecten irradians TaxID=31199 RepID=UPI003718A8FB
MSLETVPKDPNRNLRACLFCSLVKTFDQFELDGCDNCEEHLHMKNNRDAVYDCTSANFDGMVAMMSSEDSWVAKWQRIGRFVKGCYALSVTGRLPPGVVRELKRKGIMYRPRDVSQKLMT